MNGPEEPVPGRLGIEISDSSLAAVIIDANGQVVTSRTSLLSHPSETLDALNSLLGTLRSENLSFASIGLAIPGLVDRKTGRVAYSAKTPSHTNVNLVEDLTASSGVPVIIENDANAAAYGEYRVGAGRGARNIFYATVGAGVGGAFIFNGRIWRGASGYAGEFGYMPINAAGTRLEDVASADNIVRRTKNRLHQDSTSSLNRIAGELTLNDVILAARSDDDFSQMMLERTGTYLGTAIASVINLLNIERIIIGGPITQAKHIVLEAIIARARELSFGPSFQATAIIEGELGTSAAAIGAAYVSGTTDAE
jgi:glucokinase